MHILYLSHRIPYPPNKGDKIRSYHELRYLSERHEVDLGCLCDDPHDLKHVPVLEKMCRSVCVVPLEPKKARMRSLLHLPGAKPLSVAYFHDARLQRCLDAWFGSRRYDAVLCFSSPMAEYLFRSAGRRELWGRPGAPRKVMDFCDLDSDKWAQYARETSFPWNVVYSMEAKRLFSYEAAVHDRFDASIFISQKERDLFRERHPSGCAPFVVGNGVDTEYFAPADGTPRETERSSVSHENLRGNPSVVFVGAMDYHANVDGVLWFVRHVWPQVRRALTGAEFMVVGSRPVPPLKRLHGSEGIRVTGFVPDVRPYVREAFCSVAPLRLARGIQNKVLEAMAMGKAVVATTQALEGLEAVPGRDVLCADTADSFVRAVVRVLEDAELRDQLGRKARSYVLHRHSWPRELAALESILSNGPSPTRPCPTHPSRLTTDD